MKTEQQVEVVARLDKFMFEAIFADFALGGSLVWDLSVFVIVEPENLKGKEIGVQHKPSPAPGTPWRDIGGVYRMTLNPKYILEHDSERYATPSKVNILSKIE